MKVLISAYACNPYGGSEPGVGWAAVCRVAKRHDVWVITDIHNRVGWEQGANEGIIPANVKVRFLRDRSACSQNRFIAHLQSWMNYASFNRQILAAARDWHREVGFDLCHQVTIAGWRMPSPLWQLPIPFIWGPIGGAGYIPSRFRGILSPSARLFEKLRDANTALLRRSQIFKHCIQNTAVVFAANKETEIFLLPYRNGRPLVLLPIASFHPDRVKQLRRPTDLIRRDGPIRLFAGGNMEGRKGVGLALQALRIVASRGINFHYTVAGGGPEIPSLKSQCHLLGLDGRVEFHGGYCGDEYVTALHQSDVYFLPSFRESTPVTLLEACLAGCFPVVADTSAQGEIVGLIGGRAVKVHDVNSLVNGLADAIEWCHLNPKLLEGVAMKAADAVNRHFSGDSYERAIEDAYQVAMKSVS